MTCYHPVKGFASKTGGFASGGANAYRDRPMSVPCGRCIGCRLKRSQEWALRCVHEAQLHEENCFLTLTYDDEALPDDYSVSVRDVQLFIKRLRKRLHPRKVRFFACGEYGETTLRPHYHLLVFGWAPSDQVPVAKTSSGHVTYSSPTVADVWGLGHIGVGPLTWQTAAYTARYVMKKVGGRMADNHYVRTHPITGEQVRVRPEFAVMSRRPGIGGAWFDEYAGDVFPSDFLTHDGRKFAVPRFYDKRQAMEDAQAIEATKLDRRQRAADPRHKAHTTPERLAVRETVQQARLSMLKRDVE